MQTDPAFLKLFLENRTKMKELYKKTCECSARILIVDNINEDINNLKTIIQNFNQIKVDVAKSNSQAFVIFEKDLSKSCECKNRTHQLIFMNVDLGIEMASQIMEIVHLNQLSSPINTKLIGVANRITDSVDK